MNGETQSRSPYSITGVEIVYRIIWHRTSFALGGEPDPQLLSTPPKGFQGENSGRL
jgi:hypothetical protein